MASSVPWYVVAAVISAAVAIIAVLLGLYLRSIKHCVNNINNNLTTRLNRQDLRIEQCEKTTQELSRTIATCKVDCERNFVPTTAFLRETGFARRSLEQLTATVNRFEGKLTVVEKLPQICGDISRAIVTEMQNGAH